MNPFEALGDPNRRAIVELLRDGDRSVQELADALPISRPAVLAPPPAAQGRRAWSATGRRARGGCTASTTRAIEEVRHLSPATSGATPRRGSRSRRRTYARGDRAARAGRSRSRRAPEHAFSIWAERTTLLVAGGALGVRSPPSAVVFEPRPGGRIYERAPRGDEHEWGRVTALEPPPGSRTRGTCARTAPTPPTSRSRSRRVPDGTAVAIVHSGWERLGAKGPDLRERNTRGWAGAARTLRGCRRGREVR